MKFVCSKDNLLNSLQIVSKAVPNKTTMSILQCIMVDTSEGEIKLIANDMELGIETVVEGEILEKGHIAIDAKMFLDIVRKLPDADITIETDLNNKTTITCEKLKFNILGKSGEDFTYLPEIERKESIDISQFALKEIIRQTIFSVGESTESNKALSSEYFEIDGDNLTVTGLDGHRIAIRKIKLKESYEKKSVIIPGKSLNEIIKIISGDADKIITIYFSDKHIIFEFDNTVIVSRIVEGNYFDTEKMFNKDYETKVVINKKDLVESIDRATLLVKEGDKKPIIINLVENTLELKINSTMGSMNEEIDITKNGKDLMIGFNPKFLIDALKAIDEEEITLYLMNSKSPCLIKDDEENYIYLILPVNFATVN